MTEEGPINPQTHLIYEPKPPWLDCLFDGGAAVVVAVVGDPDAAVVVDMGVNDGTDVGMVVLVVSSSSSSLLSIAILSAAVNNSGEEEEEVEEEEEEEGEEEEVEEVEEEEEVVEVSAWRVDVPLALVVAVVASEK